MRVQVTLWTLLLLFLGSGAYAQITSSSMAGVVKDETNKGLPGATVRAVHQPSGTGYGTTTQDDGSYNIQGMRVGGPYTVEVTYIGFDTKTFDNIYLTLGETFRLNASMAEGTTNTLKEVAVIGGRNPLLNNQRTGATTGVSNQQLNTLPTIGRSLSDFTRLTPQAGPSFGPSNTLNNGSTFGGRDGRYNNVQINGANVNNAFGLSSDLLPGGSAQPISLDAIEELQIGIAPYDVRQSNFTGANINAVTRSGSNTFTGSAYTYWRNQNFNGRKVRDRDLPAAAAATTNIYGIRLGGPIVKNKLFFFVNAEHEEATSPLPNWVATAPGASGNVSRVSADSLNLVKNYLMQNYSYDPGSYQDFLNTFGRSNTKLLARIDWNISDKHKFFVSYNQLDADNDVSVNNTSAAPGNVTNPRIGNNALSFSNSRYGFSDKVKIFSAELSSNFSKRLSNQLLATYTRISSTRTSPSSNFPFVDIATGPSNINDNQISFGYELFSYQNDLRNNTLTVFDNLTYTKGRHEVTGGIQFDYITFANSFLRFGTGYYRYASVQDFVNNRAPVAFAYTYPYGDDPAVSLDFAQGGIYLQDKINLTNRFTVTAGLRVDMPFYLNDLPTNFSLDTLRIPRGENTPVYTGYSTSKWPAARPLWSPRVSFNWDALGNRDLQFRGGTGVFTGRLPFVWFTNQAGGIGTLINSVTISDAATLNQIQFNADPNAIKNQFPSRFPTTGENSIPGEVAFVSPNFKFPQIWRTNIAADFRLPFGGLIGTVEGIYTQDINNVYQRNANLAQPTQMLNNGNDHRPLYASTNAARVYPNISGIYVLENAQSGKSYSATIGLSRPARKGFYGSLYYTGTYSTEISSNPGSQAGSAWNGLPSIISPNDPTLATSQYLTPHRVVGNVSYRFEWLNHFGTTLSIYYEGASAGRYSYLYGSDINRDGANNDLIWIPYRAEDLQWTALTAGGRTFTVQEQIDAFNQYMDNDKYLDANRGKYAERYGAKYPFYSRFDFKFLQDVFQNIGKRRGTLQFSIDMLNFPNFINGSWGVQNRLNAGSGNRATILNVASYTSNNTPVYRLATTTNAAGQTVLPYRTFTDDFANNSTWGMQLGLRLLF